MAKRKSKLSKEIEQDLQVLKDRAWCFLAVSNDLVDALKKPGRLVDVVYPGGRETKILFWEVDIHYPTEGGDVDLCLLNDWFGDLKIEVDLTEYVSVTDKGGFAEMLTAAGVKNFSFTAPVTLKTISRTSRGLTGNFFNVTTIDGKEGFAYIYDFPNGEITPEEETKAMARLLATMKNIVAIGCAVDLWLAEEEGLI